MKSNILTTIVCCFIAFGTFAQVNSLEQAEKEYQQRLTKDKLEGVYIPKDLADCFVELNRLIDNESKQKFKNLGEGEAVHKLYFSLGGWIRYHWSLWRGSRLSKYMNDIGIKHPDYMSVVIIATYHRYLNKKPLNMKELVTVGQEKWAEKEKRKIESIKERF